MLLVDPSYIFQFLGPAGEKWAEVFRNEALPLIDEERFAPMCCVDNGRPNRAVQTVLGVHLLKEMFNLTDDEALEQLEFNLLWHHALRLDIEETHLPQKTLHNFRVRLMQHDGGRLAFQETTDRIIQALGIRTWKQRLDSTHIMSNIATLTRLGLFCETMRLFLRALRWEHRELRPGVPEGLLGRISAIGRRRGDPLRGRPHGGGWHGPWLRHHIQRTGIQSSITIPSVPGGGTCHEENGSSPTWR